MSEFKPKFICYYCEQEIPSEFTKPLQGALGVCNCEESMAAWEIEHRMETERRKKLRGKRKA